jgi:hypothetical protein
LPKQVRGRLGKAAVHRLAEGDSQESAYMGQALRLLKELLDDVLEIGRLIGTTWNPANLTG